MSGTKRQPDAAASLAAMLRGAEPVPAGAKLALVLRMSVPAMMAEFASMAMSFIDAAMIELVDFNEAALAAAPKKEEKKATRRSRAKKAAEAPAAEEAPKAEE